MKKTRIFFFTVVAFLLFGTDVAKAQTNPEPLYESKFVETRSIRLQYMDFEGSGLPVIFLQDFHDYFQSSYTDLNYQKFLAEFSDHYRVLAPIRRGYGKSDDTGYGYDVATQSEDLLGFMDALGIERAVLVGRLPANQDMTWIAEHHPERVIGLVYVGNPLVMPDLTDPLVREFAEIAWQGSCDLQEKALVIVGSRAAYRPDFLYDKDLRINIPAIRFSLNDTIDFHRRRIQGVEIYAADDNCGNVALQEYFKALAADKEKMEYISEKLRKSDLSKEVDHAMERAFDDQLQTILVDLEQDYYQFQIPPVKRFLEKLVAYWNKDN